MINNNDENINLLGKTPKINIRGECFNNIEDCQANGVYSIIGMLIGTICGITSTYFYMYYFGCEK
jgi:hypothetical protein